MIRYSEDSYRSGKETSALKYLMHWGKVRRGGGGGARFKNGTCPRSMFIKIGSVFFSSLMLIISLACITDETKLGLSLSSKQC